MSATATDIDNKATEYVLALANLGDATRNRNNPICVMQPKVAKASTMVSVACHCHRHYRDKLHQCKHGLMPPFSSLIILKCSLFLVEQHFFIVLIIANRGQLYKGNQN